MISKHWMLDILLDPMNIYHLKQRQSYGNINIINLDNFFVEKNIAPNVNGEAEISCRMYQKYMHNKKLL